MSRGHGWLQRTLLDLIEKEPKVDTFRLAALAFNITASSSFISGAQHGSVRRALLALERADKIRGSGNRGRAKCQMWVTASYADASANGRTTWRYVGPLPAAPSQRLGRAHRAILERIDVLHIAPDGGAWLTRAQAFHLTEKCDLKNEVVESFQIGAAKVLDAYAAGDLGSRVNSRSDRSQF
jgi:hypothetical protein